MQRKIENLKRKMNRIEKVREGKKKKRENASTKERVEEGKEGRKD